MMVKRQVKRLYSKKTLVRACKILTKKSSASIHKTL